MSLTVQFDETETIRLTDNTVEARPPDRVEFSIRGSLTASETLLAEFEGATLDPVSVTVSTDNGDESVTLDLTGPASLRLENVDVGVASPDADSIPDDLDALLRSAAGFDAGDSRPDVLAFTVEGSIRGVSTATLDSLATENAEIEGVTFAVDDAVKTDGGSEPEILLELALFGYGIVVRRDGAIVVGSNGKLASIDLP